MDTSYVRTIGDPVLRQKAKDVTQFDENLETLAGQMVNVMLTNDGIGLAAPQVGLSERFLVIGLPVEGENNEDIRQIFAMANPEILETGEETEILEEGCLSIPEINEDVERWLDIKVRFQDLKGELQEVEAHGVFARVIQHEMDHLDGVLFVDRISVLKKALIRNKLKKLEKEHKSSQK